MYPERLKEPTNSPMPIEIKLRRSDIFNEKIMNSDTVQDFVAEAIAVSILELIQVTDRQGEMHHHFPATLQLDSFESLQLLANFFDAYHIGHLEINDRLKAKINEHYGNARDLMMMDNFIYAKYLEELPPELRLMTNGIKNGLASIHNERVNFGTKNYSDYLTTRRNAANNCMYGLIGLITAKAPTLCSEVNPDSFLTPVNSDLFDRYVAYSNRHITHEQDFYTIAGRQLTRDMLQMGNMFPSRCGTSILMAMEYECFPWFYSRTNPVTNKSDTIMDHIERYKYPTNDRVTAFEDDESWDIHHMGIILAFLKSYVKKASGYKSKNIPPAYARFYTNQDLTQFELPANVDGEYSYLQKLTKELITILQLPIEQFRQRLDPKGKTAIDYKYTQHAFTQGELIELIERELSLGRRVIPLIQWELYDKEKHIFANSPRHTIAIVGNDEHGNWRIYDSAYKEDEIERYVSRETVVSALYLGQFIIIGSDSNYLNNLSRPVISEGEDSIQEKLSKQIKLGQARSSAIGHTERLTLLEAASEVEETIVDLLTAVSAKSFHLNSFPGNITAAILYTLRVNQLPYPTKPQSVTDWSSWIHSLANNPRYRSQFAHNLIRAPSFSMVERYVPIHVLQQLYFDKRFDSETWLDLGCGSAYAGQFYQETKQGSESITALHNQMQLPQKMLRKIYTTHSDGVDASEYDPLWAECAFDPGPFYLSDLRGLQQASDRQAKRFKWEEGVYRTAGIFDQPHRIMSERVYFEKGGYDTVTALFTLHQTERSLIDLISVANEVLRRGGIFFNAGFETERSDGRYELKVYRKRKEGMEYLGTPIIYDRDQKSIYSINYDNISMMCARYRPIMSPIDEAVGLNNYFDYIDLKRERQIQHLRRIDLKDYRVWTNLRSSPHHDIFLNTDPSILEAPNFP